MLISLVHFPTNKQASKGDHSIFSLHVNDNSLVHVIDIKRLLTRNTNRNENISGLDALHNGEHTRVPNHSKSFTRKQDRSKSRVAPDQPTGTNNIKTFLPSLLDVKFVTYLLRMIRDAE